MAEFKTTFADAQDERNYTLTSNPSFRAITQKLSYATFAYTVDGAETDTDTIKLGSLGLAGAVIIPELCRIRATGAGDFDADLTLQRVTSAGSATSLTAALAIDNNVVAFASPSGPTAPVELNADDYLQLLFSSTESTVAADVLYIEIAYRHPKAAV